MSPRHIIKRTPPKIAAREDVEEFAAGLSDPFLECRRQGHNFRLRTVEEDSAANVYDLVLRCPRCRSERVMTRGKTGAKISDRIVYSEGYLMHGLGRMDTDGRDAVWMETITRHQRQSGT